MHIGGADPEEGGRDLRRAMGAPETLNGVVRAPAGLEEVMTAALLVLRADRGMVGAPCAPRVGEDEDGFLSIHEGGALSRICRSRPALDPQAPIAIPKRSLAAPGHFGHELWAEGPEKLVKCRRHWGQQHQILDQTVAQGQRLARENGPTVSIGQRHREGAAIFLLDELHLMHGKRVGQIPEDIFPRREHRLGQFLVGLEPLDAARQDGLAGRDDLHDGGPALFQIAPDRLEHGGHLQAEKQVAEEALLRTFKRAHGRRLGRACTGFAAA